MRARKLTKMGQIWLSRAEDAESLARQVNDPSHRLTLRVIARTYYRLAMKFRETARAPGDDDVPPRDN